MMPDRSRPPQYLSLAEFEAQVRARFPHVEWRHFRETSSDEVLEAWANGVNIIWRPCTLGENWTVYIDPSETLEQAVEAAQRLFRGGAR